MATAGSGSPASVSGPTGRQADGQTSPSRALKDQARLGEAAPGPAAAAPAPGPRLPATVENHLFAEPYAYDFFQAVRLLERLDSSRRPVGYANPPRTEVVRFRAHMSLS